MPKLVIAVLLCALGVTRAMRDYKLVQDLNLDQSADSANASQEARGSLSRGCGTADLQDMVQANGYVVRDNAEYYAVSTQNRVARAASRLNTRNGRWLARR